jgi:polyphosphate kinase
MIPVHDPESAAQLEQILQLNLADDVQSWSLGPDGRWTRVPNFTGVSAQRALQQAALERSLALEDPLAAAR